MKKEQQPASAEPAGTKRNRSSDSMRKSSRDKGFVGSPTNVYSGDTLHEGCVGSPTNAPGHKPFRIDDWPLLVEIYSHDKNECCWYTYCDRDSEPWCLRLDCRPLYDPNANTNHDGRHPDCSLRRGGAQERCWGRQKLHLRVEIPRTWHESGEAQATLLPQDQRPRPSNSGVVGDFLYEVRSFLFDRNTPGYQVAEILYRLTTRKGDTSWKTLPQKSSCSKMEKGQE